MKDDFILAENEVSIAVNKISNLAAALSASIDRYIEILSDVQTKGIRDQQISGQISSIQSTARSYQGAIAELQQELIEKILNPAIEDAETEDAFIFPSEAMAEVKHMLSKFS